MIKCALQKISGFFILTAMLSSISANAGAIGFDPGLQPETQIYKANTFSANGKDPLVRVSKRTGLKEFSAIGKITTLQPVPWKDKNGNLIQADAVQGTGFLISPCLVMTDYHSVFGLSKSPNKTDFSVSFTANRKVIGKPLKWPSQRVGQEIGRDWTIVKLEDKDCLGSEVGFLKMLNESLHELKNPKLLTAGYPGKYDRQTGPDQLWAHLECSIRGIYSKAPYADTLFNDCATSGGQSGSPLLVRNNAGEIRYVGMQASERGSEDVTYREYNIKYASVGVDLLSALTSEDFDLIDADIESHPVK